MNLDQAQVSEKFHYFIETFGCQMNILDSELVEGQLRAAGHQNTSDIDKANVVIFNTCSVRDLSEQKVLSRLGTLRERKERGERIVIAVMGCMAERAHNELLAKKPFIDILIGPSKINLALGLIEDIFYYQSNSHKKTEGLSFFVKRKGKAENPSLSPMDSLELLDKQRPIVDRKSPWQAYVRITRGCNKFCSFCVVPRTRGPEVHRHPQSIIDEVKALCDHGAKEVTLLGQTINHYLFESGGKKTSFADLLFRVHEEAPHLERLRFLTSHPKNFTDEALDVMATSKRICNYLHIPAQSGSDKVLREMNRGYDLETYLSLIDRARSRMPDIALLGDMIVGFPGESDEDFEKSLELLKLVRYKNVFVFKYSPRPNTTAIKNFADNVPMDVKKSRHKTLMELQNQISLQNHLSMVGKSFRVLCEAKAKYNPGLHDNKLVQLESSHEKLLGRTHGDHIVHFPGNISLLGKLVDVKIENARALSLDGQLV